MVGVEDPDPRVAGRGIAALRDGRASRSRVGVAADEVAEQLAPYLKHRTTGQPWVVLKMAASLDARTAAPDGTSRWITGEAARQDVHRLRARSDAVLVGAGTVRADDPELTVRLDDGVERAQPLRVVLGQAPAGARVHPALELSGDLGDVLTELGRRGVLQLLVEGGATRGPRLPRRRPGRPLRPVPGARLLRGRRRPPAFRGPRGWHNWGRVEGQAGVGRAAG